jgi:hypothetical protein
MSEASKYAGQEFVVREPLELGERTLAVGDKLGGDELPEASIGNLLQAGLIGSGIKANVYVVRQNLLHGCRVLKAGDRIAAAELSDTDADVLLRAGSIAVDAPAATA